MRIIHLPSIAALFATCTTGCTALLGLGDITFHDPDAGVAPVDGGRGDAGVAPLDAGPDCLPAERLTFYRDSDGDTYGRDDETIEACAPSVGYAARGGDCDDDVMNAFPGATEVCDGVDGDCDGTIDEGVFGLSGTPIPLISSLTQTVPVAVAAHATGYFVTAGPYARWLHEDATPASDAFSFATAVDAQETSTLVFEATSPPRAIVAYHRTVGQVEIISAKAYSVGATTTSLVDLQTARAPAEWNVVGVDDMRLVPLGDEVAVIAVFDAGFDQKAIAVATIDPVTWRATNQSSPDPVTVLELAGTLPVASTPPSVILSVVQESLPSVLWRLTTEAGPTLSNSVADLGENTQGLLPRGGSTVPADQSMLVLARDYTDDSICPRPFLPGDPGAVILAEDCTASLPSFAYETSVRGGVLGIMTMDGFYEERSLASGTEGTSRFDTGITNLRRRIALRDGRGLVVYQTGDELLGQRLGCEL